MRGHGLCRQRDHLRLHLVRHIRGLDRIGCGVLNHRDSFARFLARFGISNHRVVRCSVGARSVLVRRLYTPCVDENESFLNYRHKHVPERI